MRGRQIEAIKHTREIRNTRGVASVKCLPECMDVFQEMNIVFTFVMLLQEARTEIGIRKSF